MSFTDIHSAKSKRYCIGYAALAFKQDTPGSDCNRAFICNETGDGWFRRDNCSGPSSGHGLSIIQIEVLKNKVKVVGDFQVHSVKLILLGNNEIDITEESFWLYIHKDFSLAEVLRYIYLNSYKWRP
jgi:hypothetical protein